MKLLQNATFESLSSSLSVQGDNINICGRYGNASYYFIFLVTFLFFFVFVSYMVYT